MDSAHGCACERRDGCHQPDDVLGHGATASGCDARAGCEPRERPGRAGAPDPKQTALALFGNNGAAGVTALPAREVMTAEVRPALLILFAAVALLFLASTASLIVLQLSRVARRAREIAVRTAIGAGNARLVRQWIVESSLLGAAGAASGLLMAMLLHRGLPAVLPAGFPRVDDVRLDWRVAMFACGVALARQPGVRNGPRVSCATRSH